MSDPLLPALDERLHARARLGAMTLLLTWGESDFATLKAQLGLTDGNLGAHLRALEEAGYLAVEKGFAGRRPRTRYRVTPAGEAAFRAYLRQLEALIRLVAPVGSA